MTSYWNRWSTVLWVVLFAVLLTLVLAAGTMNASAQEAPPVVVTPDGDTPPVVVVSPAESVITNGGVIVMALLLAFATGGATVGACLMVFARSIRTNPELARAIERLYLSTPADKQVPIRQIITGAREGIVLADELTDGDMNTPVKNTSPEGGAG